MRQGEAVFVDTAPRARGCLAQRIQLFLAEVDSGFFHMCYFNAVIDIINFAFGKWNDALRLSVIFLSASSAHTTNDFEAAKRSHRLLPPPAPLRTSINMSVFGFP